MRGSKRRADAPGLRERKKQELRERIFETATSLFRRQGFAETKVDEIAANVDISLKTFFNYFPSKQAVLDEHVARLLADFDTRVRSLGTSGAVAPRLRTLMRQIATNIEADRDLALIVFRESKLFNADDKMRRREHESYRLLAGLFREGQEGKEFRDDVDALQLAELFFATLHLTTLNWLAKWWKTTTSLSSRLDKAVDILLVGLTRRQRG